MLNFCGLFLCLIGITSTISLLTTGISTDCYLEASKKQHEEVKVMYLKTMDNLLLLLKKEYYDKHYKGGITSFFDNNKLVKELNTIFFDYCRKIDIPNKVILYYAKSVERLNELTNEAKEKITKINNLVLEGKIN